MVKTRVDSPVSNYVTMVKTRPITMLSCGYAERYRWQELKSWGKLSWDVKPEQKDIIKWM